MVWGGVGCAEASSPRGEISKKNLEAFAGGGIVEVAVFVEFLVCAAKQKAVMGESVGMDSSEDVAEMILCANSAVGTGTCAEDTDGFVSERGFVSGSRSPIDGIFEDARDAVVVFGGRDQEPVGLGDGVFEGGDSFGECGFEVAVVEGDIVEGMKSERYIRGEKLLGGL